MTRSLLVKLAIPLAALIVLAFGSTNALAATGDPDHVTFTHAGCRLLTTTSLPGPDGFVCSDAEYTTGNLGKNWNELDNVPFRLTGQNGGADQTYTVAITADHKDGGHPGYDVISIPVLNKRLSTGGVDHADENCGLTAVSPTYAENKFGGVLAPGVGGTDESLYRKLTIFQKAGATCVFDWYARLALGSHLYPGSSLHTNLTNQSFGTSGIGAKDVSIPVKEILPQELSKSMRALQGASYAWDVSKSGTPSINFNDTCEPQLRSATVTSSITWTRSAPSPEGEITVTTTIKITNPSHRTVIANVQDTVYSGTDPVTPSGVGETNPKTFDPVTVQPNSTATLTNTMHVASGTTDLNDIATATYTDPVDADLVIPGNTQATASAAVETSNTINQTATVVDTEAISGDGLSFSVSSVDDSTGGSFTSPAGYTLGDETTAFTWQSGTIDPGDATTEQSGTITFHKTVYLDGAHDISDGALSDTATLTDSGSPASVRTADWTTDITANKNCATLTIAKVTDPAETDPATATEFTFTPSDELDPEQTPFGLHHGESKQYTELVPGRSYTVTEASTKGYRLREIDCTGSDNASGDGPTAYVTPAPGENVTCTFVNEKVITALQVVKTGTPDVVHDGDNVTFTYTVSNPSSSNGSLSDVTLTDDKCADVKGPLTKSGGNDDDMLDPGESWTYSCTTPAKHTDEDANHVITNVATATAKDEFGDPLSAKDDDTTKVIHPAIKIDKTGPATAEAGQKIAYVLTVTNPGDVSFPDPLKVTDEQCNGDPVRLLSRNGDSSDKSFDPGDVWTYTCSLQTAVGDTGVENHASVEATDQLGKVVDSASAATTVLTQPDQLVLPERVTPGAARLSGPTGCVSKAFNARVRGSKIATVTFVVDGKVVKKVKNTKNAKVIQLRVNPAKLKFGVHRLVVTVTFQSGSGTKPKTMRLSFQRCGKKLIAPRFTG